MSSHSEVPYVWGATTAELDARYASDELLPDAPHRLVRATSTTATPDVMYRWLCQLQVAPYSYDLVDNFGRQSPRALIPGLTDLVPGQPVMTIFTLASFARDEQLTLWMAPDTAARAMFGTLAITYAVRPTHAGSRLVGVLRCVGDGAIPMSLLAWGDLLMMRKQLHTLARLAEDTVGSHDA